jgi:predicted RNA-binding Zn-ribbon protein involved in translation (DUF1610 family)
MRCCGGIICTETALGVHARLGPFVCSLWLRDFAGALQIKTSLFRIEDIGWTRSDGEFLSSCSDLSGQDLEWAPVTPRLGPFRMKMAAPTDGSRLGSGGFRAHIGKMPLGAKTTVVFACPKCSLVYRAMQERRSPSGSGRFQCGNCGAEIYRWSSYYDYLEWSRVEPNDPSGDGRLI